MPRISFEKPPLIEVSFGVQFERLSAFRTAHFGLFWSQLAGDFPETADRPPLAPVAAIGLTDEWLPLPRVWLVHKDKKLLIQLQNDRFLLNWRRLVDDAVYPRFDSIFPDFYRYLRLWEGFCESFGLGPLQVRDCELTYVNHIPKGDGWNDQRELNRLFPSLIDSGGPADMPARIGVAATAVFGFPALQLRADIKQGFTGNAEQRREIIAFELKAESAGRFSGGSQSLEQWFNTANEAIVDSFVALTAGDIQREVWKRVSD